MKADRRIPEPPDLWPEIESRLLSGHQSREDVRIAPRRQRVGAAVVALSVFALSGIFLVNAFRERESGAPSPQATDSPWSGLEPGESVLEAEGTSLLLPEGWEGRADSLPDYTYRIFQAATFPLPPLTDIESTDARGRIGPADVLIVLEEFSVLCPPCPSESTGLPVVLDPTDFEDPTSVPKWLPPLTDVHPEHALARRIFNVRSRFFDLWVEFGSSPVTQRGLDQVNAVLSSLTIGAWVPEPNGICQWYQLGMLDPDCPQPNWLREVLSQAGFRIVHEGGTFVARSGDVEFFIRVEAADQVSEDRRMLLEDRDAFPVRETIRTVTVYGSSSSWEWSTGDVHVFIDQGPDGDSKLPTLEELTPIVEVTMNVPYAPEAGSV